MNARHAGLGRVLALIAAVLCALPPLLGLGLLAQATLGHQAQRVRTGDALADAYLQALVDDDLVLSPDALLLGNTGTQWSPRRLSERAWYRLEQRCGADARFWLLCYYNLRGTKPAPNPAGAGLVGRQLFLERARACNNADWRVYYLLESAYNSVWGEEADRALGLQNPSPSSLPEKHLAYQMQRSAEIKRRHGPERAALYAALARTGKDEAQVQYELARRAYESGDIEGALACMAAGNAAPHNTNNYGVPYEQLLAAANQGQALDNDRLLTGRLAYDYILLPPPNVNQRLRMARYIAGWAAKRGERQALSTLHRFNCRAGAASGADILEAWVAIDSDSRLVQAYAEAHAPLSGRQAQRCADMKTGLARLSGLMQYVPGYCYNQPSQSLSSLPARNWRCLCSISSGGRDATTENIEQACKDFLKHEPAVTRLQQQLAAFNPPLPWEP